MAGNWTATIDPDGLTPLDGSNGGYHVRCKLSPSSSYTNGNSPNLGDAISGTIVGFNQITKILMSPSYSGTVGYIAVPIYDSSNVNVVSIAVYGTGSGNQAALSEVASGNYSSVVFDAIVHGI